MSEHPIIVLTLYVAIEVGLYHHQHFGRKPIARLLTKELGLAYSL